MKSYWLHLQGNEAIRYLEFCVQKLDNKDLAIHNYLLSLYGRLQPENLMTYLQMQGEVISVCTMFGELSFSFFISIYYKNFHLERK